jgi:hypothetical protein
MRAQDLLAQQFGMMYYVADANVAGMTHEHSLKQPAPGGNCANWILGHMTDVQNGAMGLVGESPAWESKELNRASYDPITGPAKAIDWDTMRSRFLGSRDRFLTAVAKLADEKLAETVPHPFGGQTRCITRDSSASCGASPDSKVRSRGRDRRRTPREPDVTGRLARVRWPDRGRLP